MAQDYFAFDRITVDDGLAQSTILDIHQDSEGFLWFATQDGLNRFDGYEHLIFRHNPEDPGSLSDNRIRCIYTDSDGNLWVGSEGGLSWYDPDTGQFQNYRHNPADSHSLGHNTVRAIYEDSSGELWIGTRGGGLNRFDRKSDQFDRFVFDPNDPTSIGSSKVSSIIEDQEGNLWIGTFDNGLSKLDPSRKQFTRYGHEAGRNDSLSNNKVITLFRDKKDTLWIGTYGGGINRFIPGTDSFFRYQSHPDDPFTLSNDEIRTIEEDEKGRLWIGTNSGLNVLDPKRERFHVYSHDPFNEESLAGDIVLSLHQDLSGIIWIGTKNGISQIVPRKKFFNFPLHSGAKSRLGEISASAIVEEENGTYLVGTNTGGLHRLDLEKGIVKTFATEEENPASLSSNDVRSILKSSSNTIWVGTYIGGLNKFDKKNGTFTQFRHDDSDETSLSGNYITTLIEGQGGIIWVGTNLNGLNAFDPVTSRFKHYKNDPADSASISSNRVWTLLVDSSNNLWAGTYGAGLNRLDQTSQEFTRYHSDPDDKKSLSNNVVLSMFEDSRRRLWIGTQGGLNTFNPASSTFTWYTEEDGLANNVINGIAEDSEGNIWLSTNKGISKFDPQTVTFNNYDNGDGVVSNEFNPGACIQNSDGRLIFGGRKGVTIFSPPEIQDNQYVPPVVFTSLSRNGEKLRVSALSEARKGIEFKWPENSFEFSFAALNYISPDQNQYAYMLEGLDEDWYFAGSNHQGRYSSIPPGHYFLRVKGSNNDGVWNDEGDYIEIIISPPPWKTVPAYLVYSLVIIGFFSTLLIHQKKKEKNKRIERERLEDLVASRTNELRLLNERQREEIEKRKTIENELVESERKLSALIGNLPGMVYRCRNEEGWPMEFLSDGCLDITGFKATELVGNPSLEYGDIVHVDDRKAVWRTVQESVRNDEPFEFEYRIVGKSGEVRWVWERGSCVPGSQSDVVFLEGFISDITRQKELTRTIQQSQKMESIGNLAGGIAHDFNNILSSILGFTEIVLDEVPKGSLQEESLREIYEAGIRARDLVKQILAFARKTDEVQKPIRIDSLLGEVLRLLRPSTPTTIEISFHSEGAALVMGNKSQLHQVLLNLCTNATQSMQDNGGELKINLHILQTGSSHQEEFGNVLSGPSVAIEIMDTGPGIAPEIIDNIFEPYFTTKGVGEGSGMGLAMVKGIIDTHNGDIRVSSCPEETVFTVTLPMVQGDVEEGAEGRGIPVRGSEHLLVVDDEPAIVKVACLLLRQLGYTVTSTTESPEALELFRANPEEFDLVLTDMTMPVLTGDKLAVELRKIRPDIPIIVCTGYSSRIQEGDAKLLGINGIAYKPFTKNDFAETVREVLDFKTQEKEV